MTHIRRSHPQPDSPRENLGPRERALGIFKYVLGIDPEQAAGYPASKDGKRPAREPHPMFALVVHTLVQANRAAVRAHIETLRDKLGTEFGEVIDEGSIPQMDPSLVDEISTITQVPESAIQRLPPDDDQLRPQLDITKL